MKIQDFAMSFRDEILEMEKIGVIKISKNGTIQKTTFGNKVHEYMHKTVKEKGSGEMKHD